MRGWNSDREVVTTDVTNTGHGGDTARVAGKRDARGTVTYHIDLDDPNWGAAHLIEGTSGIIQEYVSPTKYLTTPIVVKKVHAESAVDNVLQGSFDWEMNKIAGAFSYPAT